VTIATTEPDNTVSSDAVSSDAVSSNTVSSNTVSSNTVSPSAAPASAAPASAAPASAAPASAAPARAEAGTTPADTTVPAATPGPTRPAATHGTPKPIVGRRKEAIVRVRMLPGGGNFVLNGRSLESYFPNKVHQQIVKEPLVTVDKVEMYDIFANLRGGGVSGQAGALRLAIARALISLEADDRPSLKKAGFLTRDSRETERKKYGLKKARKAPQYSKR
jgi:small subunit ribosomal protein S9